MVCVVGLCPSMMEGPRAEAAEPVKAAVIRSQGTQFLGLTIWEDLNTGWADYGDVPVEIDYTSLAGFDITSFELNQTGADVLILSAPGFLSYTFAEIQAIKTYVQAGHGLIISYSLFRSNDWRLAPLVGLSESIDLGSASTGTGHPLQIDALDPGHALFNGVPDPYQAGGDPIGIAVPTSDAGWLLDGGTVVAERYNEFLASEPAPAVIISENPFSGRRGLYFSWYIEAKEKGTNMHDTQLFYNSVLWTAGVPEPSTAWLLLAGMVFTHKSRSSRRV